MKQRILSILLILSLCLSMLPTGAWAAASDYDSGLCPSHTEHTEDCGYSEATEGASCTHVHDESCYSDGVTPPADESDLTVDEADETFSDADTQPVAYSDSDEGTKSEHWSFSYYFVVNNGTASTFSNEWTTDLSNLKDQYDQPDTFQVTVQINYENTNQIFVYQAGELRITVPNLMYGHSDAQIVCTASLSA